MCSEQPGEWDRYLPALLFAYRECPQSSTGFAPFELLYGRSVRGPLTILREIWDKDNTAQAEIMSTYEYVFKLREKLEQTCRMAQQNLKLSEIKYKTAFDRRTRDRQFKVGDKVLFHLPTSQNELLLLWQGPYEVVEKRNRIDYVINQDGSQRIYHANLLKLYVERGRAPEHEVSVVVVDVSEDCYNDDKFPEVMLPQLQQQENIEDVVVNTALSTEQQGDIARILVKYKNVLTDV